MPDAHPGMQNLLAGTGDHPVDRRTGLPVRSGTHPAYQSDRVEKSHPLRRDQDRPQKTQNATTLTCISTQNVLVP